MGYLRAERQAKMIQGAHLHLIVEAADRAALSKGIQALGICIARGLNRLAVRRGPVFADRYHEHVLGSLREVANAVRYVLDNFRHHVRLTEQSHGPDPLSSAGYTLPLLEDAPVVEPALWKLKHAI